MRLSEVIISIVIFFLALICFSESYTVFIKNERKIKGNSEYSVEILKTDKKLRKEIKAINVPYWKNTEKEVFKEMERIMMLNLGDNVKISSVKIIKNENGIFEGLSIAWSYKERFFETRDEFCFCGILK